jgi:hypothetical protein
MTVIHDPMKQPTQIIWDFFSGEPATPQVVAPAPVPPSVVSPTPGAPVEEAIQDDGVFAPYAPFAEAAGSQPHPEPLVESAAMASVRPPRAIYLPDLPENVIKEGLLSDAQLESVIYAGQAHEKHLPSGLRQGFFLGDGTGVGKGRQIAGMILDNWRRGRRKAVWVSANRQLAEDARRDARDIGLNPTLILDFNKIAKVGEEITATHGVLFTSFNTLKQGYAGLTDSNFMVRTKPEVPSRMEQIVNWLGRDFDGLIFFDESHSAGNAIDMQGKRGIKAASKNGIATVDIQQLLPQARVVYVSATGATEVSNLSYADRLGIWGPGMPFASKQDFIQKISAGGLSAMEIVARDMKAMGVYLARSISFKGVEFGRLTQILTPEQVKIYNYLARAWQKVFCSVDEVLNITEAGNDRWARSAALSTFWGAQQRFFNQLLTALEMPILLSEMDKDLAAGNAIVLQIVNTNEAIQARQLAEELTKADVSETVLEDMDLSPRDILIRYIEKLPTIQYEEVADPHNPDKSIWIPLVDSAGNPVENPRAIKIRTQLIDELSRIPVPENPLEQILEKYGADKVAEVTGRTKRVVWRRDDQGRMKKVLENRTANHRVTEAKDFQDDRKQILIFSKAGGIGASYHADMRVANQRRRSHYLLQAGWIAAVALQGFGRTHRSNQRTPPFYKLVETNIEGHKRFISTIARRLAQLGALTTGERKSTGQGLFSEKDNLESPYASEALRALFVDLHGRKIDGLNLTDVSRQLGFGKTKENPRTGDVEFVTSLVDENGKLVDSLPNIPQFLNRILVLELEDQNRLFGEFYKRLQMRVDAAVEDGSYDPGLQLFIAHELKKVSDETLYEHGATSAKTRLVEIERVEKREPRTLAAAKEYGLCKVEYWVRNRRSGAVYALKWAPDKTSKTGEVVKQWRRVGTHAMDVIARTEVVIGGFSGSGNYQKLSEGAALKAWNAEVDGLDLYVRDRVHFLVGSFLPIWDRIPIHNPRIYRIITKSGEKMLGTFVSADTLAEVRNNLGAKNNFTPKRAQSIVLTEGSTLTLANGWKIKPLTVSAETRLEVDGPWAYAEIEEFKKHIGGFEERINHHLHLFLPTGPNGFLAMKKLLAKSPIAKINGVPVTSKK